MYDKEKIPVEQKIRRDLRNLFLNALRIPSKSSVDRWRESTKLGFAILHQNWNCFKERISEKFVYWSILQHHHVFFLLFICNPPFAINCGSLWNVYCIIRLGRTCINGVGTCKTTRYLHPGRGEQTEKFEKVRNLIIPLECAQLIPDV